MLKGKNIILTGTNGMVGQVICEKLAANGANIWACMRAKNEDTEKRLSQIAIDNSVWIKPIYFDLKNPKEVNEGISSILKDKIKVDVLINNAAIIKTGLLNLTSIDLIKDIFEVNFFSQLDITKKVSKRMIRNRQGNIINISSISGCINKEGHIAYGGSKAALNYATKTLAKEYKQYGIRANGIAPGPVEIDGKSHYSDSQIEIFKKLSYDKGVASPEDVANLVVFLASEKSKHINGQIINLDGGAFI